MYDPAPTISINFADVTGTTRQHVFTCPTQVLVAYHLDEVRPLLRAVERATSAGQYAVGYLSYEAAPALDPALTVPSGVKMPLAWFGVFEEPQVVAAGLASNDPSSGRDAPHLSWGPLISRDQYDRDVACIREAIAAGTTYQLNYTMRFQASFRGDDYALYQQLRRTQPAPYSAYLNLGRYRILSLSPELFFKRCNGRIVTRPMKGTAARGRWTAEDDACVAWLAASEKNRAENLMIVDLLRNDLGRVAQVGSVHVPELFTIERYPTVLHMTSTVTAIERPGTRLEDVFAALFPCGSVTGVPKVRTMHLIARLETMPREVYCGAIGVIEPGGHATFNVAIRTVCIDTVTASATYGVGGGITWDSTADEEYTEALAKTVVLHEAWPQFELIETLRLKRGKYALLDAHLQRLADSARYFGIPLNLAAVRAKLQEIASICSHAEVAQMQPSYLPTTDGVQAGNAPPQSGSSPVGTIQGRNISTVAYRIRVRVDRNGTIDVETGVLPPLPARSQVVALAQTPINGHDRFLFHKTTHRAVYKRQRQLRPDVFDVLLWNEAGELTEFTIGNLVVKLDGRLWTPPRRSGLLAGVFRDTLLRRGTIAERVLWRDDLADAHGVWLINSVRGWVPVVVLHEDGSLRAIARSVQTTRSG